MVTIGAVLLAILPPLLTGGGWAQWIERACIFLVISCPCALVISVPLGFFGGIGAASRIGVLVKGSNYLEAVSEMTTIVMDKTGTLTRGEFKVTKMCPTDCSEERLLEVAALGEGYSNHPIAISIREAYGKKLDMTRVEDAVPVFLGIAMVLMSFTSHMKDVEPVCITETCTVPVFLFPSLSSNSKVPLL